MRKKRRIKNPDMVKRLSDLDDETFYWVGEMCNKIHQQLFKNSAEVEEQLKILPS